jgi:hypothetical protein
LQIRRFDLVICLESLYGLFRDARQSAAPAGVNRRRESLLRRDKQQWHAIGSEYRQKNIRLPGDHSVRLAGFFEFFVVDLDDLVTMHLAHSHDSAVMDAGGQFQIADVLTDDLRIVADSIRGV